MCRKLFCIKNTTIAPNKMTLHSFFLMSRSRRLTHFSQWIYLVQNPLMAKRVMLVIKATIFMFRMDCVYILFIVLVGWGRVISGDYNIGSDELLKVKLRVISTPTCNNQKRSDRRLTNGSFCASALACERTACQVKTNFLIRSIKLRTNFM